MENKRELLWMRQERRAGVLAGGVKNFSFFILTSMRSYFLFWGVLGVL